MAGTSPRMSGDVPEDCPHCGWASEQPAAHEAACGNDAGGVPRSVTFLHTTGCPLLFYTLLVRSVMVMVMVLNSAYTGPLPRYL